MSQIVALQRKVSDITENITYKPDYRIVVLRDEADRTYMQVWCKRIDIITGEPGWGKGGRFYVDENTTEDQIVQGAFGLFKAYEEHECREWFRYQDKRIYGPHISLDALMEIADRTTYEG